MGVDTAPAISAALVEHGRDPKTPVAVVSDGATPAQRSIRTTLAGLAATLAEEQVRPPAVWVVGDVVGLGADQHGEG
jgi:uroporphyrin-III C-methyltransferase/precorrin-2 dehydrogenase/sirohydrochlorin ferrochelatase